MASLRRAGHTVWLLAPRSAGGALVGPGPAEANGLIDGDAPETAALFAEDGESSLPAPPAWLRRLDLGLVYSRNPALAANLRRHGLRTIVHDPAPPPAAGHASRWLARPLEGEGIPVWDTPPPCVATEAEAAEAALWQARLPPRFLAVHPGSGSPAKNWPPERFSDLVRALSGGRPWALVEGPADAVAASRMDPGGAVRVRGLGPRVLGALLAHAGLFVGNDSGASHLAAAWGAPTLALFGPTDPAVWAPLGSSARTLRSPDGAMDGLGLAPVLEAAHELLASAGAGPGLRS